MQPHLRSKGLLPCDTGVFFVGALLDSSLPPRLRLQHLPRLFRDIHNSHGRLYSPQIVLAKLLV